MDIFLAAMSIVSTSLGILILLKLGNIKHKYKTKDYYDKNG